MIKVKITKAEIITFAYMTQHYPAYSKILESVFSGGKVLFDLRVRITDSNGFVSQVKESDVTLTTFKKPVVLPPKKPLKEIETVNAAAVELHPGLYHHVQAFAKSASVVEVTVNKGGIDVTSSPKFNVVEKK